MMQLRIINSTIIDIFNMSIDERRIGLNANTNLKKQNKFKIIDEGIYTTKYLKTNHDDQEWDIICTHNIQQALNLGFLKKSANSYDYDAFIDYGTNLGHYEKKITINRRDYIVKMNCTNDEISITNPLGWNFKIQ